MAIVFAVSAYLDTRFWPVLPRQLSSVSDKLLTGDVSKEWTFLLESNVNVKHFCC